MIKGFVFLLLFLLSFSPSSYATDLLLLKTYDNKQDLSGWLMSEKLDGIRGVWTGKELLTKNGNVIYAPPYFIKSLPSFALDGELWTIQNDFETIQSIVLRKKADSRWSRVKYHIFDVPNQQGGLLERLQVVEKYLQDNPGSKRIIRIITQELVRSAEHVKERLAEVIAVKGEGLVVRSGRLAYHTGRSSQDLKVKQSTDAECLLVGYKEGAGKFSGLVGSLTCELANKMIINIGTGLTRDERKNPPTKGSIITFKYYGFTKTGKPKFPVFMRVRLAE